MENIILSNILYEWTHFLTTQDKETIGSTIVQHSSGKEKQRSFLKGKPWENAQSVTPNLFVWTFFLNFIGKLIITNSFQEKLTVLINELFLTSHKTVLKNS